MIFPELHHLMFTAGKTAFDPHTPNKTLTGTRFNTVSFFIDSSFGGQWFKGPPGLLLFCSVVL